MYLSPSTIWVYDRMLFSVARPLWYNRIDIKLPLRTQDTIRYFLSFGFCKSPCSP